MSVAPYTVRANGDDIPVDDLEEAKSIAADCYDPAGDPIEIIDDRGRIVFDPAEIVGIILEQQRAGL